MNIFEIMGDTIVISLPKEVDDYRASMIIENTNKAFADERIRHVVFDFKETCFMDSSGIGLITRRFRDVYDRGGTAAVVNVNPRIDKILLMSGIYKIADKLDK